jgi:tetratricopeptide (TPR) repeat protein
MVVATAEESDLGAVRAACDTGRYLDAWAALDRSGGVEAARSVDELILASRVARNLGGARRARLLAIRAHRLDRHDAAAAYHYASALSESRGPWEALTFLRGFSVQAGASATARALLLLRRVDLLLVVRDFEEAHRQCDEAAPLWDHPAVWARKAAIFAAADSWTAAEEAAARALELGPACQQGLGAMAACLVARGRSDEADHLLAERGGALQSPHMLLYRAQLCLELERLQDAKVLVREAARMYLLAEPQIVRRMAGLAAAVEFKLGEIDSAVRFYRMAGEPAQLRLASRLAQDLAPRRVLLGVPQVRQDHKTCAPATLTALCRYFERAADQVSIVEEICYDGTPSANERRWAESHGFVAKHFTVTWDAAVALLDRGLPFALQTIDVSSAHLQPVVGYDVRRGSFLVRDPSIPVLVEMDAAGMLEAQAAVGPQGMVMVPVETRERLDGITLPDEDLRERLYRLQVHLLDHRRDDAARELAELERVAPQSVVTMMAARALAAYDGNQAAQLEALDRILAAYPEDPAVLFARLSCLEGLERPEQRRNELLAAATRAGAHPVLKRMWGEELARDGRQAALAALWLGAAICGNPRDSQAYFRLAQLAGARNERRAACELMRAASCIEDANEVFAVHYFRAMRYAGLADQALAFLRKRVDRLGRRSAQSWITLYVALTQLGRIREAAEILAAAREALPKDGAILLETAWTLLRQGRTEEAAALGEQARTGAKDADLVRFDAELARLAGRREAGIERWRMLLSKNPLALEAYVSMVRLLRECGRDEEALRVVREAAERYPHHAGLGRLLVEVIGNEGTESLEVVRRLVALAPSDAWARRELAGRLARRQHLDEAMQVLDEAVALDPDSSASHGVRGFVLRLAGRYDEARDAFRKALSVEADNTAAFGALLDLAEDDAEGLRAIRFVQTELRRQVGFGAGLAAWRRAAHGRLPEDEVLAFLEEARAARPDTFACWDAVVSQLTAMRRLDEALTLANEMTERFPLVIEALLRRSDVEGLRDDLPACRQTLEKALEHEPWHSGATMMLADLLARDGDLGEACRRLEKLVERSPLDVANVVRLADLYERSGRRAKALAAVRGALERDPTSEQLWELLVRWARMTSSDAEIVAVAEQVVIARPESAAALLGYASVVSTRPGREQPALAALENAIAREPHREPTYDRRAVLLTRLARFDDALLACKPAVFGAKIPLPLRGRRAWVLAEKGDLDEATLEMEAVIADSPSYLWGLLQLGGWYAELRKPALALRIYGLAMRARPGAAEPALGYFDAARILGDFAACDRALASIRDDAAPRSVEARRVLLDCSRGRVTDAMATFSQLCKRPRVDAQVLVEAGRTLVSYGYHSDTLKALRRAIEEAPDLEATGVAWAELLSPIFEPLVLRSLFKLTGAGPAGERAVMAHVEVLVSSRRFFDFAVAVLFGGRRFQRSAKVWAYIGQGLLAFGRYRWAARWLSSYTGRPDARPWMLAHVVAAFVAVGKLAEAKALSQRVVHESSADSDPHRRWLAFHAAVEGNLGEARDRLSGISGPSSEIGRMVEAYARAIAGATEQEGANVARRKSALAELDKTYFAKDPKGYSLVLRELIRKSAVSPAQG